MRHNFHFHFLECACWWDITRNDCACCKKGVGAMQCGYFLCIYICFCICNYVFICICVCVRRNLLLLLLLPSSVGINCLSSVQGVFLAWSQILTWTIFLAQSFVDWIFEQKPLPQVPNAQVLLQEVWHGLPWSVQLQVHPLRKRLPMLLRPLQVSVISHGHSG